MHKPPFRLPPLKSVFFKNPFAVLAHPTPLTDPNGRVTPPLLMHYKALAKTEAAMVIVGPATVMPPNSRRYSLLRALTKIIEANGSVPAIQLAHGDGYEANEILAGAPGFKAADDLNEDRLAAAFRNACQRVYEIGFRYVELNAFGHLLLHRLIEEDREDLVRDIFQHAAEAAGPDLIAGLRLSPQVANRAKYESLYLELGGDLIAYDTHYHVGQSPQPDLSPTIPTLRGPASARQIKETLKTARLIGLPLEFREKRKQIYRFLSEA